MSSPPPSTSFTVNELPQNISGLSVAPRNKLSASTVNEINKFGADSRELIDALSQNTHLSKQLGAGNLADQARAILADAVAHYSGLCNLTRASATQVRKLKDMNIAVTDDETIAYDITLEVKRELLHITDNLHKAGTKEFKNVSLKISDFQDKNISETIIHLQRANAEDEAEQMKLTNGREFTEGIDPPQSGGSLLGVLIAFITTPFVKHGVRKGTRILQRKILAIKECIDARQAEISAISSIDAKVVETRDLAGDCQVQWLNVHKSVWNAINGKFIKDTFPTQKITPEIKQRIEETLGALFDAFHQLEREMASVKEENAEDPSMSIQVEEFSNGVQDLSCLVRQLFSLSDIVRESHSEIVRENAQKLARFFQAQLELLLEVIVEWMSHIRHESDRVSLSPSFDAQLTRLLDANKTFPAQVHLIRQELVDIHSGNFSAWKSSQAKKKRERESKIPKLVAEGLPLGTSEHVEKALNDLKVAIETVWTFSLDIHLSLIYWSSQEQGGSPISPNTDDTMFPTAFRKNPFLVDEALLRRTRGVVERECMSLRNLAVNQQRALMPE